VVLNRRLEPFVAAWKAGRKLVMLTAYDSWQARLVEDSGADILLVGDSLGNVEQGQNSTAVVTLDEMVYHTRMASRGRRVIPIVSDLPYRTYDTPEEALASSRQLIDAGADAVKFEGNADGVAEALLKAGIPVIGHLGLLPQTAAAFKVQGKDAAEADGIRRDARSLAAAGCFGVVLECIPESLGTEITAEGLLPTIGIGAGPGTSGQVLVFQDLLHLVDGKKPKFVPQGYTKVGEIIRQTLGSWASDVRGGTYPTDAESYH
jgi:3-methyl-2-oxobutanoate hydroxymethyltransferase